MSPAVLTIVILIASMVLFATEAIPLTCTAFLVSVSLFFAGIISPADIFANGVGSAAILMFAMPVVGQAFFKTGMAYKTGKLITRFAKTERGLIAGVALVSGVMSGFLSNSCTLFVLLPIVSGIAISSNIKPAKLMFPLLMAITIGSNISILGSPSCLVAKSTLEDLSNGAIQIGFFEQGKLGIPLLIGVVIFFYVLGPKIFPNKEGGTAVADTEDYSDIPQSKQIISTVILLVTIVCMILKDFISWLPPIHITACCAALLCVLTGLLSEKEAFDAMSMKLVLLMVFMMPLGSALSSTGAGQMIADLIISIGGSSGMFVAMVILWIITWAVTQFMSNTAACTLICPVAYLVATSTGADPRALVFATLSASSIAFCTPIAVPHNVAIMEPAGMSFRDFFKPGLIVSAVCFVLCIILLPIMFPFFPS